MRKYIVFSMVVFSVLNASKPVVCSMNSVKSAQAKGLSAALDDAQVKSAADTTVKFDSHPAMGGAKAACEKPKQVVEAKPRVQEIGLHIACQQEIAALLKKYGRPIVVHEKLKVTLTEKALEHVFGMTIKRDGECLGLTGFHHDNQLQLQEQDRSFFLSLKNTGGQLEGFVAYKRNQLPVFKTFFSPIWTREKVIETFIKSLKAVKSIKQEGEKRLITGKALDGTAICTVIDAKGKVVTFYPVAKTSKLEHKQEQEKLQTLFKKCFLNLEHNPERKPITKEEIETLAELYPHGIQVNWLLRGEHGLAERDKQQKVLDDRKLISNVIITDKALAAIFAKENDAEFPVHLSRAEILQKLKEALQAVAGNGTLFLRKKDAHGNHLHFLGACSKGSDERDIFQFNITVNADTGELEALHPLFG